MVMISISMVMIYNIDGDDFNIDGHDLQPTNVGERFQSE